MNATKVLERKVVASSANYSTTVDPAVVSKPPQRGEPMGEPAWDIARLFPAQGQWSEEEYFTLDSGRLVEFSHGFVEVLPMPTERHQAIVAYLYRLLYALTQRRGGKALFAAMPLRLWTGKMREPDLMYLLPEHLHLRGEQYWQWSDLVIEVVSEGNRAHDLERKRFEYARAGIPEYWIVDPLYQTIIVLRLEDDHYVEHGVFGRGETATSALLPDLATEVGAVFDAD